jgi:hypothetical protein
MQGPLKRRECDGGARLGMGGLLRAGIPRKAWRKRHTAGVVRRDSVPGDPKPPSGASRTQGIAGYDPPIEDVHQAQLLVVIALKCSSTDDGGHVALHTQPPPVEVHSTP